jgi:tRNA (cytidine/uridine-2'-O-)-methyltransferase
MFGKESAGIPEELLVQHPQDTMRIPMLGDTRSLNLSNAAAIVIYEALRHQDFAGLNARGDLHRLKWED